MDRVACLCDQRVERMRGEPGGQTLLTSVALEALREPANAGSAEDERAQAVSTTPNAELTSEAASGPPTGAGADEAGLAQVVLDTSVAPHAAPARVEPSLSPANLGFPIAADGESTGTLEGSNLWMCRQDHPKVWCPDLPWTVTKSSAGSFLVDLNAYYNSCRIRAFENSDLGWIDGAGRCHPSERARQT